MHIPAGWGRRHLSRSVLAGLPAWLIIGRYLLYYVDNDDLRAATSLTDWPAGLVIPVGFLANCLKRRANGKLPLSLIETLP
jgi:hypothetical protein